MILLWGPPGDPPLNAVSAALARRRAEFMLVDQREVLEQRVELDIGTPSGAMWIGECRIALEDVNALYMRVYDARTLRRVIDSGPAASVHVQQVETALWAWADETRARVVNRPAAMASNGSKPYQAMLIARTGFLVPETLVTTDPEAAAEFWAHHGRVIYKSVSGVRSMVSRLGPEHRARLADIAWCPTQFQAYVPGIDHRVHVVGHDVFAVEIASSADDYRYAHAQGTTCELRATVLPPDICDRAREVARALDLPVCGLDLRRTPDGQWYCFEANPSPAFTYYEQHTRQPLADAIAALLHGYQ